MALGDKVEKLQQDFATISERLDNVYRALEAVRNSQMRTARELGDLRREHEKEIALLKREDQIHSDWKADQKRQQEEHGRRLWAFGPNVVGAIINGLIAAIVAYFVARH